MNYPDPESRIGELYKMLQRLFLAGAGRPPTVRELLDRSAEVFENNDPLTSTGYTNYLLHKLEDDGLVQLTDIPTATRKLALAGGIYVLPRNVLDQRSIGSYSLIILDARNTKAIAKEILNVLEKLLADTDAVIFETGTYPGDASMRHPKNRSSESKETYAFGEDLTALKMLDFIIDQEDEIWKDVAVVTEDKPLAIAAMAFECGVFSYEDV